jgi:aspartate aminotransferase
MPVLSDKATKMPASPIRKLVPYAESAKQKGKHVIHLNIGQPDIETPAAALQAVKENNLKVLEYSHSAGFESYRKGLVKYYEKFDISINHHQLLITTGGSEALSFAFASCCNEGDEIIIPEPFYANYNGFAVNAGLNVIPVTATIDDGFALPPIEEFEKKITSRTKAIMICNPANPTGYLYTQDEIKKLSELVKKHDLFLFSDEVYREFCYDGASPFSVLQLEGLDDNVVMVDSVSKRYSMCGARIGALVTRNQDVLDTAMKFAQARLSPPTYAQIAAEAALDTPESYFKEVSEEYVKRRDIMVEGLNKIEGVICPKPKGAFYCVAKFPVDDTEKFCQWLLEDFDYNGDTVMMAPLSGFYATPGLGAKEARIAYVLEQDQLQKALVCLEKALEVYPGRQAL